jgi:hypothetical protein
MEHPGFDKTPGGFRLLWCGLNHVREKVVSMQPLIGTFHVLAVTVIFCLWQAYRQALLVREWRLRERVAYMLWVMANQVEEAGTPVCRSGHGSQNCPRLGV